MGKLSIGCKHIISNQAQHVHGFVIKHATNSLMRALYKIDVNLIHSAGVKSVMTNNSISDGLCAKCDAIQHRRQMHFDMWINHRIFFVATCGQELSFGRSPKIMTLCGCKAIACAY